MDLDPVKNVFGSAHNTNKKALNKTIFSLILLKIRLKIRTMKNIIVKPSLPYHQWNKNKFIPAPTENSKTARLDFDLEAIKIKRAASVGKKRLSMSVSIRPIDERT